MLKTITIAAAAVLLVGACAGGDDERVAGLESHVQQLEAETTDLQNELSESQAEAERLDDALNESQAEVERLRTLGFDAEEEIQRLSAQVRRLETEAARPRCPTAPEERYLTATTELLTDVLQAAVPPSAFLAGDPSQSVFEQPWFEGVLEQNLTFQAAADTLEALRGPNSVATIAELNRQIASEIRAIAQEIGTAIAEDSTLSVVLATTVPFPLQRKMANSIAFATTFCG